MPTLSWFWHVLLTIAVTLSTCQEDLPCNPWTRSGVGAEAVAKGCGGNDDKEEEWQKYADECASGSAGDLVPMF